MHRITVKSVSLSLSHLNTNVVVVSYYKKPIFPPTFRILRDLLLARMHRMSQGKKTDSLRNAHVSFLFF